MRLGVQVNLLLMCLLIHYEFTKGTVAMVGVEGSNPFARSRQKRPGRPFFLERRSTATGDLATPYRFCALSVATSAGDSLRFDRTGQ